MNLKAVLLLIILIATSCTDGGGQRGRGALRQLATPSDEDGSCTDAYVINDNSCKEECPSGTHAADEGEIEQAIEEVKNLTELDEQLKQEVLENINSANIVCVNGSGVLRPNLEVFISSDFCACKDGKPDLINTGAHCFYYCTNNPSLNASTLTGNVTVGPAIALHRDLGNLENWCNNKITNSDLEAPSCVLEISDGFNTQHLTINIPNDSNKFSVNISSLAYERTYVASIVEMQSGSNVRSDTFQIYRKRYQVESFSTPLKIEPITQYSCLTFFGERTGLDNNFEQAVKLHFYFPASSRPPSLAPGNPFLTCHDKQEYGEKDSPLYPRIEESPHHFALWSTTDIRFADQNQNQRPDINEEIQNILKEEHNIIQTVNIFSLLNWPNRPNIEGTPPNIGFVMQPWIDSQRGRGFCPKQEHYNSNDPIFNILKEFIGVDTEAIYLSQRENESYVDQNGEVITIPIDIIIIRENLLKKVWFYFENGRHIIPDETTANQKTIHFYYPLDINEPYIRKSTQKIYTIRAPSEIGQDDLPETGLITNVRPPDRRFACVPAIN